MKIYFENDKNDLNVFRKMIVSKWETIDSFDVKYEGIKVCPPILAKEEGRVIGGVSFTWHKKPDEESVGLWVNALYVMQSKRNKGVGSALLKIAMNNVKLGYGLFALTDKPNLYLNCGWSVISRDSTNYVLKCRNIT